MTTMREQVLLALHAALATLDGVEVSRNEPLIDMEQAPKAADLDDGQLEQTDAFFNGGDGTVYEFTATPVVMAMEAAINPATAARNIASCLLCSTSAGTVHATTDGGRSALITRTASVADVAGGMVTRNAWRPKARAGSTVTPASELATCRSIGLPRRGKKRRPAPGGCPASITRAAGRSAWLTAVIMYQAEPSGSLPARAL